VAIFASEHGDAFHFRWLRQDGEMRLRGGARIEVAGRGKARKVPRALTARDRSWERWSAAS
jgi:hypothetical protein